MKVTFFQKNPKIYSCNSYLICGSSNALEDVNTIIDPGTDDFIFAELQTLSTGVGKRRVEQIILTHEHFDHAGGIPKLVKEYHPKVIALSSSLPITQKAYDGQILKVGDREAQIIVTPGHSSDSICIYVPSEKTLFSGDTPLNIKAPGNYPNEFIIALERIMSLDIKTIYSGHDMPCTSNISEMLRFSYENVMKGQM